MKYHYKEVMRLAVNSLKMGVKDAIKVSRNGVIYRTVTLIDNARPKGLGWESLTDKKSNCIPDYYINRRARMIFTYCEGDIIVTACFTETAFEREVNDTKKWIKRNE